MCKKVKKIVCIVGLVLLPGILFAADYDFVFQSSDVATDQNFQLQKELVDSVYKETGGRVKIDLRPVRGVVDNTETFDAIRLGLIDGHITSVSYLGSKDPAFALIGNTVGAWSEPQQMLDYIYEGGGKELLERLYHPYDVHFIGAITTGLEAFVSTKPLDKVSDLKGLKIRSPGGLISDVFLAVGAKPVNLPGSQIVQALQKGVIEAADYSVFSTNQYGGFNDVANHPVYPGFHSMPLLDVSINEEKWRDLPTDIQEILEKTVKRFSVGMVARLKERDEEALEEAKKNPNIVVHDWSLQERKKFRAIAQQRWEVFAEKTPDAKLVYDSLITYLKSKQLL